MRRRMSDAVWNAIIFTVSVAMTAFLTWWIWIIVKTILAIAVAGIAMLVFLSMF